MNWTARRKRAGAMLAAAIVLMAPLAFVTVSDDVDETDALTPSFWAGVVVGGIVGAIAGYTYAELADGDDADEARAAEANALITGISFGTPSIATAYANYSSIWALTAEHWIRQAELAATAAWSYGADYDPYAALNDSGEYAGAATMLANAAAQLAEMFDAVEDRVAAWADYSSYADGGISVVFSAGSSSITADSSDDLDVGVGTAVRGVSSKANAVYYAGGNIWASEACTITSASGASISLSAGWNDLDDPDVFDGADVWYLAKGVDFCGPFMTVIDSAAASLEAGFVVTVGSESLLVTTDGSTLSTDGSDSVSLEDGLWVSVVPDGGDAETCDLTAVLTEYAGLLEALQDVQTQANQAARTMWNVYNELGAACAYLTSLSVPSTYTNVDWTDEQLQIVLYLLMEQLADYYESYGELKTDGYMLTSDSLSLVCRGSLELASVTSSGTATITLEGVAYTPIFYQDTTLTTGSNATSSYCFVIVWGECSSLSSFSASSFEDAQIVYAEAGSVLNVTEMYYEGVSVSSVDLDCTEVDWIDPYEIASTDPVSYDESDSWADAVRLVLLAVGCGLILLGVVRKSWATVLLGAAVALGGWMLAEWLR